MGRTSLAAVKEKRWSQIKTMSAQFCGNAKTLPIGRRNSVCTERQGEKKTHKREKITRTQNMRERGGGRTTG